MCQRTPLLLVPPPKLSSRGFRAETVASMKKSQDEIAGWRDGTQAAFAAGDFTETRRCLERLWELRPGAAHALLVERCREALTSGPPLRSISVAVLRSFTIEPVIPLAKAEGLLHGIDLTVRVGEFNTYAQELLNPLSPIVYGDDPVDLVILATQSRDVAPDLWDRFVELSDTEVTQAVERVAGEFAAMVDRFRANSGGSLVVHGLEVPCEPSLGLSESSSIGGQVAAFRKINGALRSLCDATSGVYFLDLDRLVTRVGRNNWHDDAKWIQMKMPLRSSAMAALAAQWVRFLAPLCGASAKVLVVDLDNTMWGGVVGELGRDGVALDPETVEGAGFVGLQRSVRDVRARGVLLAISSKNNYEDAIDVLENRPTSVVRPGDFAAMRINWEPKAENIRSIAAELNIGLDSVAFIDDNPAECDQVRRMLPEVTVIELHSLPRPDWNPIAGHPRFERLRLSNEDRSRSEMYTQQRSREELRTSTGSLDDFLHALDTKVEIGLATDQDIERVAQLTQKTNQCNLTTKRYTETEIDNFRNATHSEVLVIRASDRFGDHGVIGVAITTREDARVEIDTFLLSCRVIGRGVEVAMLAAVARRARAAGAVTIDGLFVPTAKNVPAAEVYADNGFDEVASDGDQTRHCLDLTQKDVTIPAWIECIIEEGDQS